MKKNISGAADTRAEGSYLKGALGALIGSVIGIAVWVGFGFVNVAPQLGAFIAGILACYGYTLLKGKVNGKMTLITAVIIFILSYVSVFVTHAAADAAAGSGAFWALLTSGLALPFNGAPAPIWVDIVLGWLLGLASVFIFSRMAIRRSAEKAAQKTNPEAPLTERPAA